MHSVKQHHSMRHAITLFLLTATCLLAACGGGPGRSVQSGELPVLETSARLSTVQTGSGAVAGLSMGGYGTLYYCLKYPGKFTYGYAMSPATADWFPSLIDAQPDKKVFPPLTIEVGTEDMTVNNADSEALARYMKEQGLQCEWIARSGIHYWNFWQECLPKALKKIGETF